MRYLLDVNVLVAWGWDDHIDHDRTASWIARAKRDADILMTSPIPQLGFVRVSCLRTGGHVTVSEASETLRGMLESLGKTHRFLNDDQPSDRFEEWCRHPSQTTDAHLIRLAQAHDADLATLDTAIRGAVVIPE